ncbi:hypothetical protein K443DRAFT_15408 [Laccaria amethystina LaAM-08-1]|uniref:Uncharacterized protein n=1 Tax=Laccaria amethystina LaAM-08-1 TaxID=1095629 RepID=A0A0C9WLE6_9AGAR|nr:hypothetical protein K443DRAFT_15408 [Laccaria amethystina LaAM-08-1]
MLALFKPWRTGQQKQSIQNFNIRYECNDARDDFSAQQKKGDSEGIFPQWMSNETMLDLDELNAYDGAHFGDAEYDENDQENIPNKYTDLGKYGRANQEQMNATKIAVKEAG